MTSSSGAHEIIDGFLELFQGNLKAYGTEEGLCARTDSFDPLEKHIEWHLTGDAPPVGVYPMRQDPPVTKFSGVVIPGEWRVHWGCIDFDEGEEASWLHAQNVRHALEAFGVVGWVERSRSKGYHVWVFLNEWMPAPLVRKALLASCQIVGAPTREINPKQYELEEGQVGNYVRLPYPAHLAPNSAGRVSLTHRVMLDPDGKWFSVNRFVERALHHRTGSEPLQRLAELYVAPARPIPRRDWKVPLEGDAVSRLRGVTRTIFLDGPLDGSDRSDTLWKLARYLREDGLHTKAEAMVLLRDADSRWGKYANRRDCEVRLTSLLDKAWSGSD